jgi:hypothetical protein
MIAETRQTSAPITTHEGALRLLHNHPPDWAEFITSLRAQGRSLMMDWDSLTHRLESEWEFRELTSRPQTTHRVNTVTRRRNRPVKDPCTNCSKQGKTKRALTRTIADCYWPGGGKAGQFPKSFRKRRILQAQETTEHSDSDSDEDTGRLCTAVQQTTSLVLADSGASQHSVNNLSYLYDLEETEYSLETADGSILTATLKGKMLVQNSNGIEHSIHNIYYLPTSSITLLSLGKIDKYGHTITIQSGKLRIINSR